MVKMNLKQIINSILVGGMLISPSMFAEDNQDIMPKFDFPKFEEKGIPVKKLPAKSKEGEKKYLTVYGTLEEEVLKNLDKKFLTPEEKKAIHDRMYDFAEKLLDERDFKRVKEIEEISEIHALRILRKIGDYRSFKTIVNEIHLDDIKDYPQDKKKYLVDIIKDAKRFSRKLSNKEKAQIKYIQAVAYYHLADYYDNTHDFKDAYNYFRKSMNFFSEVGEKDLVKKLSSEVKNIGKKKVLLNKALKLENNLKLGIDSVDNGTLDRLFLEYAKNEKYGKAQTIVDEFEKRNKNITNYSLMLKILNSGYKDNSILDAVKTLRSSYKNDPRNELRKKGLEKVNELLTYLSNSIDHKIAKQAKSLIVKDIDRKLPSFKFKDVSLEEEIFAKVPKDDDEIFEEEKPFGVEDLIKDSLIYFSFDSPLEEDGEIVYYDIKNSLSGVLSGNYHKKIRINNKNIKGIFGKGLILDGKSHFKLKSKYSKSQINVSSEDLLISFWAIPVKTSTKALETEPIFYIKNLQNKRDLNLLFLEIMHRNYPNFNKWNFGFFKNANKKHSYSTSSNKDRTKKKPQHIVAMIGEDYRKLYVNGELQTEYKYNSNGYYFEKMQLNEKTIFIGTSSSKNYYFKGVLDELVIKDIKGNIPSDDDIKSLYLDYTMNKK